MGRNFVGSFWREVSIKDKASNMIGAEVSTILATTILFGAFGQIFLKVGVRQTKFTLHTIFSRQIFNRNIVAATLLYVLTMITWMITLTFANVSFLYQYLALQDIIVILLAIRILHEHVSVMRWAGMALVIVGVILVSQT